MSGGSFNYLCHAEDLGELWAKMDFLEEMASELHKLGYAEDVAVETKELFELLEKCNNEIDQKTKGLKEVWRAVEWWRSCDYGEDDVREALEKYRLQKKES